MNKHKLPTLFLLLATFSWPLSAALAIDPSIPRGGSGGGSYVDPYATPLDEIIGFQRYCQHVMHLYTKEMPKGSTQRAKGLKYILTHSNCLQYVDGNQDYGPYIEDVVRGTADSGYWPGGDINELRRYCSHVDYLYTKALFGGQSRRATTLESILYHANCLQYNDGDQDYGPDIEDVVSDLLRPHRVRAAEAATEDNDGNASTALWPGGDYVELERYCEHVDHLYTKALFAGQSARANALEHILYHANCLQYNDGGENFRPTIEDVLKKVLTPVAAPVDQ
jgi:hypothetical protein